MRIIEFDTQKGLYIFQLTELAIEVHSHPAVEVLVAESGSFTLLIGDRAYEQVCTIAEPYEDRLSVLDC